jgi:hypothetical protein
MKKHSTSSSKSKSQANETDRYVNKQFPTINLFAVGMKQILRSNMGPLKQQGVKTKKIL